MSSASLHSSTTNTPNFGDSNWNDSKSYQRTEPLTDVDEDDQQRIHHISDDAAIDTTTYIEGHTYFDSTGCVEYRPGSLPVVVNVPHGGHNRPASIRTRTKDDGCIVSDWHTQSLARACCHAFYQLTEQQSAPTASSNKHRSNVMIGGRYAHFVILHLHRTKLDGNRPLHTAHSKDGDEVAAHVWKNIHRFISVAKKAIVTHNSNIQTIQPSADNTSAGNIDNKHVRGGIFIDLHGQSFDHRSQLGYMLKSELFDLSNEELNAADTSRASIRALFGRSVTHNDHTQHITPADALRSSQYSLGGLLEAEGVACVPSDKNPNLAGLNYFSGAYCTLVHGTSAETIQRRTECRLTKDNQQHAQQTPMQHNGSAYASANDSQPTTNGIRLPDKPSSGGSQPTNHVSQTPPSSTTSPVDKTSSPIFYHANDICTNNPQYSEAIVSIQIETAFDGVRDNPESRQQFGAAFARAVLKFCDIYFPLQPA